MLGMCKDIRAALGKGVGDSVRVTVAADTAPPVVEVPADFATALRAANLPNSQIFLGVYVGDTSMLTNGRYKCMLYRWGWL